MFHHCHLPNWVKLVRHSQRQCQWQGKWQPVWLLPIWQPIFGNPWLTFLTLLVQTSNASIKQTTAPNSPCCNFWTVSPTRQYFLRSLGLNWYSHSTLVWHIWQVYKGQAEQMKVLTFCHNNVVHQKPHVVGLITYEGRLWLWKRPTSFTRQGRVKLQSFVEILQHVVSCDFWTYKLKSDFRLIPTFISTVPVCIFAAS